MTSQQRQLNLWAEDHHRIPIDAETAQLFRDWIAHLPDPDDNIRKASRRAFLSVIKARQERTLADETTQQLIEFIAAAWLESVFLDRLHGFWSSEPLKWYKLASHKGSLVLGGN